ncbi:MalY/PatB family protein [Saccharopolyspora taberi]|uniref:cysteine-S-conjugate beta-lyase n=1 Tax=Saccharopolyspora taberi TaxID=60895 RepID=A0ABN3VBE3_9PSEU
MARSSSASARLHAEIDALREADLRRRRTLKWGAIDADVLPAWVAEMDYPVAPAATEAVIAAVAKGDLGYPVARAYVEAFARWAWERQQWRVEPAQLTPVADVLAGIESALHTLTAPGDGVVVLTPTYPAFLRILKKLGRRLSECALLDGPDGWRMDFDAISDALAGGAKAVVLCHPHNPTGRVWSRAELTTLAGLVDAHGAHVVSDEIHAPLAADFVPYGLIAGHSVTVTSVTKGWNVAGLKGAVLVCQPETARVAAAIPPHERQRASVPSLAAGAALWSDDGGWLAAIRDYLALTRAELRKWVDDRPGIRWHTAETGYLAWLDVRDAGLGPDPAEVVLDRARVALDPGSRYAPTGSAVADGFIRFNHATSVPLLRTMLGRIGDLLDSVQ